MSGALGSGAALSAMGIIPTPIGTLEELRKEQLNPARVACCAAPDGQRIKGCSEYAACIFRLTKFGGFRDHGPHNIGYYLKTHEGDAMEREASCHWFMDRMSRRMWDGQQHRQQGKNGEIIQIVAQEGEIISQRLWIDVSEGKGLPAKFEPTIVRTVVSKFKRPSERMTIGYATELEQRRQAREAADPDFAVGPSAVDEPIQRVDPSAPLPPDTSDDELENVNLSEVLAQTPSGPAPTAAPVAKK